MNKVWNKIIAAICVLALFVTSVQILPASVADARAKDVNSIILKTTNSVLWYDEDEVTSFDEVINDYDGETCNYYNCERSADGSSFVISKTEETQFTGLNYVVFATISGDKPLIKANYTYDEQDCRYK